MHILCFLYLGVCSRLWVTQKIRAHLNMSLSLMLGLYLNPVSRVCRRPTLCIAMETGVPAMLSGTYLLPVKGVDTFRAGAYETNTCLLISITLFIIGYYFDVHFCLLDTHTVIEFWRGLGSRSWFSIPSHKQGPEVPMSSLAASPRNILSSREPDDNTCSSYTRFREALKKQREWGYCKLQDKCFSSFTQGKDLSTLSAMRKCEANCPGMLLLHRALNECSPSANLWLHVRWCRQKIKNFFM